MKYVYSLDLSITSPAICKFDIKGKLIDILYFTYDKPHIDIFTNIVLSNKILQDDRWKRYTLLNKHILEFCVNPITLISEGHSYGSNGKIIDLANFNGMVIGTILSKYNDCEVIEYSPSSIKLFATNYGLADKVKMRIAFEDKFPNLNDKLIDIQNKGKFKKFDNPLQDIVDAYFIGEKYFVGNVL